MIILFVRPRPEPETIGLQHVMIVEPLELEVLAACVRPTDHTVIIDMMLERESFTRLLLEIAPEVLCVTGYITNVATMLEYCREAKQCLPNISTIAGGVHCEVCPQDLDHPAVDFRVVRNATTVFCRLLDHLCGDAPLPPGVLKARELLDNTILPHWDFTFPRPNRALTQRYRDRYFYIFHDHVALIKTSFGCPHHCQFCFCKAITGGLYAQRPLPDIIAELQDIREQNIYIVDDDFLADLTRVEEFVRANEHSKLDKHYLIYGRADFIARHPDVIAAFRQVGLRTVIVGIESFFDDELARYHKQTTAEINKEALLVLRRLGIDCYVTLIVSPDWNLERFVECGRILKSLGVSYVNLQPLTPLPGSGFTVPADSLLLGGDDYARWDLAHVSIRPQFLSVAQFYRQIIALYAKILFQPATLFAHLRRYRPWQWWKMARGSWLVRQQYLRKIREAEVTSSLKRGQ